MEIKRDPPGSLLISIGMEERGVRPPGFAEPPRSGGEGRRRALAPTVPSDQRGMSGAAANNPSLSAKSITCACCKCERKHVVRKIAIGGQCQGPARRRDRCNG